MIQKIKNSAILIFYFLWLAVYTKLIFLDKLKFYVSPIMNIFSWSVWLFLNTIILISFFALLDRKQLSFRWRYTVYLVPLIFLLIINDPTLSTASLDKKGKKISIGSQYVESTTSLPKKEAPKFDSSHKVEGLTELERLSRQIKEQPAPLSQNEGDIIVQSKQPLPKIIYNLHQSEEFSNHFLSIYQRTYLYLNQPMLIRGMYLDDKETCLQNQAIVGRFMITCCVADAVIEGFILQFRATKPQIQTGRWVEVYGKFYAGRTKKKPLPIFFVDEMRYSQPDSYPYFYPRRSR